MKTLAGGTAFLVVILLANVVAAGVFMVLWPIIQPTDDTSEVIAATILGIVSVTCAFFFTAGIMAQIPRLLVSRKS